MTCMCVGVRGIGGSFFRGECLLTRSQPSPSPISVKAKFCGKGRLTCAYVARSARKW